MRIIGNDPSTPRQAQIVASGTLSTGDAVVVNADGTVSVVEETDVTQAVGTPVAYTGNSTDNGAAYDSSNNKVVIAYKDTGNSSYGTAIVGTVSGNSISFGTAVVFNSAFTTECSATFDNAADKIVIAYRDHGNSNQGTAIVGTVSGTSISFGSESVFETGRTEQIGATFDTASGKVVVAYTDVGNSDYGTAVVGTVSGTSISFGSPVVFESAYTLYSSPVFDSSNDKIVIAYHDGGSTYPTAIVGTVSGTSISFGTATAVQNINGNFVSAAFDSNSNKVVVAYRNENNSNYGTAAVGTVSGTSISFGTPVVFASNGNTIETASVFDSINNKVVIEYSDAGNSDAATLIVGTVSGTSISFGTPVVFDADGDPEASAGVFDTNSGKVVFAYRDNSNSSSGTAVVFQNASTAINLTSENYIGTAATGAPSGTGAKINLKGAVADVPARGFNVAGASFDSVSFSVASQDTNPNGITFSNSGTKLYIVGTTGDSVYQYTLSTAFDLSTASYDSVSFSVASQDLTPNGVAFNNDGTKMYIAGDGNNQIYQYSLSTGFDLSTASYDSVSLDISAQDSAPNSVAFNTDGTKMYLSGASNDNIYQYTLSTGFDLSTASYDSVSFNTTSQGQPKSLIFNGAGTKMYILMAYGATGVAQYSLSTAFDLSTASYDSVSFGVSSQETERTGLAANSDGTKMYVVGVTNDSVHQYSTSASLTAGQSYYVQTDGTLGTTPADPSVFAGTAVAANKLIVKG